MRQQILYGSQPWGDRDSCNLSLEVSLHSSRLNTTYTPWILESPEENSKGVQIIVSDFFCFFNNRYRTEFQLFDIVLHQMEGSDYKNVLKRPISKFKTKFRFTISSFLLTIKRAKNP